VVLLRAGNGRDDGGGLFGRKQLCGEAVGKRALSEKREGSRGLER